MLPSFLEGVQVTFAGAFSPDDRRTLRRYVITYNGYGICVVYAVVTMLTVAFATTSCVER